MKLVASHVEFEAKFIEILSDFQSMWDDHLSRVNVGKHRVKLSLAEAKPSHSAPHEADLKAQELEKHEKQKMISEEVVWPTQTE